MVLEANTTIITSLRDFYLRLVQNTDFDLRTCAEDITEFAVQLGDMISSSKSVGKDCGRQEKPDSTIPSRTSYCQDGGTHSTDYQN